MLAFLKSGIFIALIFYPVESVFAQELFRHEAEKVTIVAGEEDSLIVNDLAGFAREAQNINGRFFSHRLMKKINVYLTGSESEYDKFHHTPVPEWSSGIAYVSQHIIVLKPGNYYDPAQYRQTLIHEISHIYLGEISGEGRIPLWLNEGTAMYLSGKAISWEENIVVGNALAANRLMDLNAIDSLLNFVNAQATLAYLESFLAVNLIIETHGEEKLRSLIFSLFAGRSLDQAFLDNLGYDFFDFEIRWFEEMKARFRWIAFMQFENLFFLALVIIILLALLVRQYRNRQIYKRWEKEDQLQT